MSTDEYVPSEEQVEFAYIEFESEPSSHFADDNLLTRAEAQARWSRWLAAHDARVRRDAAREALDRLLAHAEERCGLSKSHRARDDWNTVAGATQDYRDTRYGNGA